ncbi:MAG: hypothetical protein Kow0069_14890 [Promethearchaeota archaeon]
MAGDDAGSERRGGELLDRFLEVHQPEGYLDCVDPHVRGLIALLNSTGWAFTYDSCEGHATLLKKGYVRFIVRVERIPTLVEMLRLVKRDHPHAHLKLVVDWEEDGPNSLASEEVPPGFVPLKFSFLTLKLGPFYRQLESALRRLTVRGEGATRT